MKPGHVSRFCTTVITSFDRNNSAPTQHVQTSHNSQNQQNYNRNFNRTSSNNNRRNFNQQPYVQNQQHQPNQFFQNQQSQNLGHNNFGQTQTLNPNQYVTDNHTQSQNLSAGQVWNSTPPSQVPPAPTSNANFNAGNNATAAQTTPPLN